MEALNYSKQKGFTLVEIAIVMVIIGLLLGAVLKGQNLINSARVRNMADQNSSIQAAYYGFIDRYRAVPGDMPDVLARQAIGSNNLAANIGGNGNGNLTGEAGGSPEDWGEAAALWAHLSAANFIVGSYEGAAAGDGSYTANIDTPVNAFGGRVILWRTNLYEADDDSVATSRLGFVVGRSTPASVLSELDTKVDDGRPETGVLRLTIGVVGEAHGQDATCMDANAVWDVSSDSQDCNAIYLY